MEVYELQKQRYAGTQFLDPIYRSMIEFDRRQRQINSSMYNSAFGPNAVDVYGGLALSHPLISS
jgi:hypothetical protein